MREIYFFLSGLNAETPQVSYVKAIDVWMGACTAFIFAALIEFTVVNYFWRKTKLSYALDAAVYATTPDGDGMDGDGDDGMGGIEMVNSSNNQQQGNQERERKL